MHRHGNILKHMALLRVPANYIASNGKRLDLWIRKQKKGTERWKAVCGTGAESETDWLFKHGGRRLSYESKAPDPWRGAMRTDDERNCGGNGMLHADQFSG